MGDSIYCQKIKAETTIENLCSKLTPLQSLKIIKESVSSTTNYKLFSGVNNGLLRNL